MKVTILGSGTSTGVPQIGCKCPVCRSSNPCDKRLRASALVTTDAGRNILIDCGPDFREQILREGSPALHAALLTHSHYDHVGGIDDLRPYCHPDNFDIYCEANVATDLRNRVPYCFAEHPYPGVPQFNMHCIDRNASFTAAGERIVPVPVMHARLPIVGFMIGGFAYVTDCKEMPDSTVELLRGVDTLVLNALRKEPHMSHITLPEALALVERIRPRQTYLTHLSHDMGLHADVDAELPQGVRLAYDGLTFNV